MKISYNWLKQYVDTDLSAERIAEILTETGLEVESVEKIEAIKGGLAGVVVGEVLSCEQHPDADRLKVTKVNNGSEELQIVCGAPNVAKGQKVIVANVGSTLYPNPEEPLKIKAAKIRGVESYGMLCAEDELGLGKSHDGILVLDPNTKIGLPAANYFELEDDYEIEIGLTPNRADAMGHIGVARDLVAYLNVHNHANLSLKMPVKSALTVGAKKLKIDVEVAEADLCPRYMGITIADVEVKSSPAWLQKKLRAVGLSPINNVVDITNFVMRELGTPLHAFDADVVGEKIVVRRAKVGEKFTTLDGVERSLLESNLMISNGDKSLCIAGVFGGEDSGITDKTTNVFLESAYFNPVSVRKTSKDHGLNTDASFRFERGVDPALTDLALNRAAQLILEVAGGEIGMEAVDVYPQAIEDHLVDFSYDRCNRLIGMELSKGDVNKILHNLDIAVLSENAGLAKLKVPAYRVDVVREADVIEEVLRIYGFNKVPIPEKLNTSLASSSKPDPEKVQSIISEMLVGKGFNEVLNNSLTKSEYVEKHGGSILNPEYNVQILNPLSNELDVLRQSLLFNMLEVIEHNQNRQSSDLKLFEFGKTYHKFSSGYAENKRLMIAVCGRNEHENWMGDAGEANYYMIKRVVDAVLIRMGLKNLSRFESLKKSIFIDGQSVYILKNKVAEIGWLDSKLRKSFGIKKEVYFVDFDWDVLISSLKLTSIKYTELPKTFVVRRDFSLLLDNKVSFAEIEELSLKVDRKILQEVALFDVYEGENLEEGKKSYAVSFSFQDKEQTLKDEQIDAVMTKIRSEFEQKLGAQLR